MASSLGLVVTLPYSEGIKRFTPTAMAASMRTVWLSMAVPATVDTSPSIPLSAAAKDSTDVKSTSTTLTLASYASGFLDRVRTVTWKFASTSALRT
jgi:hypothetical protein